MGRSTPVSRTRERVRVAAQRIERGFTLLELMVVVLIMGILAVIGLSSFTEHSARAKTTKTLAACRSIGVAQERYKTLNAQYLDVSQGNLSVLYPTANPGEIEYHFWGQVSAVPPAIYQNWLALAPEMPTAVSFGFATVAGLPGTGWPALGTAQAPVWPATVNDPWYIVRALGDLDGDDNNSVIIMSSFSDRVYIENLGE